jgi:uncharacterized protein YbjT (DUF2867 family)
MSLKVIITGATGMVGEGVLIECLSHPDVETILLVNRKPAGYTHPKIKEVIHQNFFDLKPIEKDLAGYNACYFCLGVSSVGMKEPEYRRLTYDLTLNFAGTVSKLNPGMTFCYISGAGTSSEEKGVMWSRVKGRTENDLKKLPFKNVYLFRPGFMQPTPRAKNTLKLYNYLSWLTPVFKIILPNSMGTLKDVGQAMINVSLKQPATRVLEVKDIREMAKR